VAQHWYLSALSSPLQTTGAAPGQAAGEGGAPFAVPTTGPLFIVFNLGSGSGNEVRGRAAIQQACDAAGRAFELMGVDDPHQLPALARQAVQRAQDAHGVVVAAGGDGTLNAVAQAVLGSGCAFGVLPQGTFNYFSRTHGIPSDTAQAMQVLLHGRAHRVQVGLVNGRVFLVNASLGLYPKLLEDREGWKQQFGRSRLVAFGAGLVTLLRGYRSLRLRIEVQGESRTARTPTLFVGNNALQMEQLGFPLAKDIDGGALAVIMLRPVTRLAMLALLLRGAFGRLGDADQVLSIPCVRLKVRAAQSFGARPVKVAIDGEIVWLPLPLEFAVAGEPLCLIRPDTPAPERAAA
jgi:diacylglycerol kinase family enzyme